MKKSFLTATLSGRSFFKPEIFSEKYQGGKRMLQKLKTSYRENNNEK